MPEVITTQCVLFPSIFRKPVLASFDQVNGSSEGGALLLTAADQHVGLINRLAGSVVDPRQPGRVETHIAKRVISIAPDSIAA